MIHIFAMVVVWLALVSAAHASGTDIDDRKRQFDYDPKEALDTKATLLSERDGAKVYDVTYASPKGAV